MQNLGAKTYLINKAIENQFYGSTHHVVLICWIQYKKNWFPCIDTSVFIWLKDAIPILTLQAAGTAMFLASRALAPGLARLRRMPGVSPSFNLCSIRLRASAWCLLVFSCSCRSFSFSAARSRLLCMSSSNSTTQSSDITERIRLICPSILQLTRLCSEEKKNVQKWVQEEQEQGSTVSQGTLKRMLIIFARFFYKSRPPDVSPRSGSEIHWPVTLKGSQGDYRREHRGTHEL